MFKPPIVWEAFLTIIAGVALGFNYIGYLTGIELTTPIVAQIFAQMGPVFLAIAGFLVFKEKFSARQGIGLLMVFSGLLIFYNDKIALITGSEIENYNVGILWMIFCAATWAIYAILQKKEVRRFDPMQLNLIIFGVPALLLTPIADFTSFQPLSVGQWALIIYLGVNTLIAYGTLAFALKYLEANKVSVIIAINPLITFGAMAVLSNHKVTWIAPEAYTLTTLIGAVVALSGVILTVIKHQQRKSNVIGDIK